MGDGDNARQKGDQVNKLLFAVGTSFLRAFGASLLALGPGILAAPDENAAVALSIAGLTASLAAGLRAIQMYVPVLSVSSWVTNTTLAAWIDAFLRAFLGSLVVFATGWFAAPDWSTWHAAAVGATVGALSAGLRALQGFATKGEFPGTTKGIPDPKTTGAQPKTA